MKTYEVGVNGLWWNVEASSKRIAAGYGIRAYQADPRASDSARQIRKSDAIGSKLQITVIRKS